MGETWGETWSLAALLGAATGIRSTAGFAILATTRARPKGSWLGGGMVRRALEAALAGEMVADKAASLPSRTDPLPWAGRVVLGAAAAAMAASWKGSSRAESGVVGGLVAAAAAWTATRLRGAVEAGRAPDLLFALGEDLAVITLGVTADRLLRKRVRSAV